MTEKEELEMLELIESIPQPPVGRMISRNDKEVTIIGKQLLDYILKVAPDAKIYNNNRMKPSDWDELSETIDLSGKVPMLVLAPPPPEVWKNRS